MGNYILDPISDVYNSFPASGSLTEAWMRVRKRDRDSSTPDTTSSLTPSVSATEQAILRPSSFLKLDSVTVSSVVLHHYLSNDENLTVEILLHSTPVATITYTTAFADQWKTLTWNSGDLTQDEINNLRINLKYAQASPPLAGTSVIYAVYLRVITTEAQLYFDPPRNNYTPTPAKVWRPRLRPGAFWI